MFLVGFLMVDLAIVMVVVASFLLPDEARWGLIGGAAGVGGAGLLMAYLSWPSRKQAPEGMVKADAYVVDARLTGGEATGYRMVEMTLDVRPKGGVPFQVTRKFTGTMPGVETGQKFEVYYDPADPEKVRLA